LLIGHNYFALDTIFEISFNDFPLLETSRMPRIFVLLWLEILTLLISTGNVVCLCQIPNITLNLEEMRSKQIRIVLKPLSPKDERIPGRKVLLLNQPGRKHGSLLLNTNNNVEVIT
jgi:hypothetical protein